MSQLGVPEDKLYTLDSLGKIEIKNEKEKQREKNVYFGWDGKEFSILILVF